MSIQPIINTIAESPHIIVTFAVICAILAFICIVEFSGVLEKLIESKYRVSDETNDTNERTMNDQPDQQAEPPASDQCKHGVCRQYICGCCKYPPDQQDETPAETQNAVEWVQSKLAPLGGGIGRPTIAVMREDDALELARRCEAAERSAKRWESIADEHIKTMRALSAELVAAEKTKQYWMESASNATCAAGKAIEERNELRAQLAAAQAEAGRLRVELQQTVVFCEAHIGRFKAGKRLDQAQLWEEMKVRAHNARAALVQKEGERRR